MQALPASFFTFVCATLIMVFIGAIQTGVSLATYADIKISLSENLKRVSLIKQVVRLPQSLKVMDEKNISILLKEPKLLRRENDVSAWHYHGESCSLAIYFSSDNKAGKPDYVEYRALSMNAAVQAQFETVDQSVMDQYCIKDILEAQGVDTPSNYARQPTPTWENPYRT